MNSNRVQNAIRNTKWGVIEKIITLICPFIVRTFLIYRLGAEFSGISSLFTSVLAVLNLTELGFSNAIIFHMYKPISENDNDKICALLNLFRKAYFIIGLIILIIGSAITPLIPKLINGDVPIGINIYFIYLVFLINSVIGYFMFSFKVSVLSAYQREDVISRNLLYYNILLCVMQCAIIYISKNYYYFVLIVPICTFILNILNNLSVKKLFPLLSAKGEISKEEKKDLIKELYGLIIWKIGGASRNSFDSMFISAFLGLVFVTMYDNYFQILNGVNVIIAVLCTSITAGVGTKIASHSIQDNYEDFKRFHFLYMWIAGWCTVCIFCLMQPFMLIWMGEKLLLPSSMVILFCYYFFMMNKGNINSVYYHAAGLWWNGKYRSIVEIILNLILNYFLGKKYGLFGIILATIISFSIVNIYGASVVFTKYFKNKKYFLYVLENFYFLLCISFSCFVTSYLGNAFLNKLNINNKYFVFLILFIFCIFIPNIIMFAFYGVIPQYRQNVSYAINIIKRKK